MCDCDVIFVILLFFEGPGYAFGIDEMRIVVGKFAVADEKTDVF